MRHLKLVPPYVHPRDLTDEEIALINASRERTARKTRELAQLQVKLRKELDKHPRTEKGQDAHIARVDALEAQIEALADDLGFDAVY